jgi:hypothetical protein
MRIIWPKVRPTGTTKGAKKAIVRCFFEHTVIRSISLDNSARQAINQVSGSQEGFIPIF